MQDTECEGFLRDLVALLKEESLPMNYGGKTRSDEFESGRAMAYFEFFDLLRSQCVAFDLDPESMGLDQKEIESFMHR